MNIPASKSSQIPRANATTLFRQRIRRRILDILKDGPADVHALASQCLGAFPGDILATTRSLVDAHLVTHRANDIYSLAGDVRSFQQAVPREMARTRHARKQVTSQILPDPHPANFDWRYSTDTQASLWSRVRELSKAGDAIALICAPTLAQYSLETDRDLFLFDQNAEVVSRLARMHRPDRMVEHDLFDKIDIDPNTFAVLVADPPWYMDYYRGIFRRAQELLKPDGMLMLSVLPRLTRPSAPADQRKILSLAKEAGFKLEESRPQFLVYETPKFESQTLEAMDLVWTAPWRKGDLLIFRFIDPTKKHIVIRRPSWDVRFETMIIGNSEIKIRRREDQSERLSIALVGGDKNNTIGTVSRRARRRFQIDIWTSDNVGYAVQGLHIARNALLSLVAKSNPKEAAISTSEAHNLSATERAALEKMLTDILKSSEV